MKCGVAIKFCLVLVVSYQATIGKCRLLDFFKRKETNKVAQFTLQGGTTNPTNQYNTKLNNKTITSLLTAKRHLNIPYTDCQSDTLRYKELYCPNFDCSTPKIRTHPHAPDQEYTIFLAHVKIRTGPSYRFWRYFKVEAGNNANIENSVKGCVVFVDERFSTVTFYLRGYSYVDVMLKASGAKQGGGVLPNTIRLYLNARKVSHMTVDHMKEKPKGLPTVHTKKQLEDMDDYDLKLRNNDDLKLRNNDDLKLRYNTFSETKLGERWRPLNEICSGKKNPSQKTTVVKRACDKGLSGGLSVSIIVEGRLSVDLIPKGYRKADYVPIGYIVKGNMYNPWRVDFESLKHETQVCTLYASIHDFEVNFFPQQQKEIWFSPKTTSFQERRVIQLFYFYEAGTGIDTGDTGIDTGDTGMDTGDTGIDTGGTDTGTAGTPINNGVTITDNGSKGVFVYFS